MQHGYRGLVYLYVTVRRSIDLYARKFPEILGLALRVIQVCSFVVGIVAVLAVAVAELGPSSRDLDATEGTSNEVAVAGADGAPPSADAESLAGPPRDAERSLSTLYTWNGRDGEWEVGGGGMLETARSNDGTVPLVLRIDGATPGATYEITLMYGGCETGGSAGFDSLSGVDPSWELPRIAPSGPASARADSTVPAAARSAGDGPDGRFELWGATFQDSRDGSFEASGCDGPRAVTLTVLAQAERLFLMWAGHVRSAETAACLAITAKVDLIGSRTLSAVDCADAGFD